jgi:hypothetical protein
MLIRILNSKAIRFAARRLSTFWGGYNPWDYQKQQVIIFGVALINIWLSTLWVPVGAVLGLLPDS